MHIADNAWIIIQGIETLSLRMERHCENSMKVALHLKSHPKVAWVRYPGLPDDPQYKKAQKYLKGTGGPMVVFGIKADDGKLAGQKFIDSLELFSHVANVGDARSLAIHPASTTHSQMSEDQLAGAGEYDFNIFGGGLLFCFICSYQKSSLILSVYHFNLQ